MSDEPQTETIPSEQQEEGPQTQTVPLEQQEETAPLEQQDEPQTETISLEQQKEGPQTETIPSEQQEDGPQTETIFSEQQDEEEETIEIIPSEDRIFDPYDLIKKFSSNYFLNKNTPSFKCLEQQLCSRSDLLITLNFFPPLTDPGLDDAFNYVPPEEEPDATGRDKYIKMCKNLVIVPIKRVIKSLGTDTLNLKYYGVTLQQMRGIADALKVNSEVQHIIFEDNWMSPEATLLISDILSNNNTIQTLNLRECRIGEAGAEKLCDGLVTTMSLKELDLSFNSLGDKGLKILQQSLMENGSIKKLNLSHNNFTEDSGVTLERILIENKFIEHLDLSWNGFNTGLGNRRLFNGLSKSETLTWLSMAWNGIGTKAAMLPISRYLRRTSILQFIDLSWNRITQDALKLARGAFFKNKSLTSVKIGHNIYTPDEASYLASLLLRAKNELEHIDMEDMCVRKKFLQLHKKISALNKSVNYGHVLSNFEIYGPNINKLIFNRCRYLAMKPKKKKAKRDFGHFVLSLPDDPITKPEFEAFLKKKKVKKIDKDLLNGLLDKFPAKGKKINCIGMKNAYLAIWPDTVLPPEKKKKKKKKKKKRKKGKGKGKAKAKAKKK